MQNWQAAAAAPRRQRFLDRALGYNDGEPVGAGNDRQEGDMLDLRIKGKKAIVCAASKGLGKACATSLGRAGVELTITARTADTLEATAEVIRRETGAKV